MSLDLPPLPITPKDSEFLQRRPDLFYPYLPAPFLNGVQQKVSDYLKISYREERFRSCFASIVTISCVETRGEKHIFTYHYQLRANNYLENNARQSTAKCPDTAKEETVIVLFLQRYESTRDLKKISRKLKGPGPASSVCVATPKNNRSFFRLLLISS